MVLNGHMHTNEVHLDPYTYLTNVLDIANVIPAWLGAMSA